jgi:phthiocerol/phenolphthiocerol synthesis type-I polyketide synthase C
MLRQAIDAGTEIPDGRFHKARRYHSHLGEAGRRYSFATGTMGGIQGFDAETFGVFSENPGEAVPQ